MERFFNNRKTKSMPICTFFDTVEMPHWSSLFGFGGASRSRPIACQWILQDIKGTRFPYNWHMKVVILSALCTVHLYPPKIFLVLVSFNVWV